MRWYRKAAEQGYARAQRSLGNHYYKGIGVARDYAEAVRWYRSAADQGDAPAQYSLGVCHFNGEGVECNCAEAVRWYRQAADQGFAWAQINMGECCMRGSGVSKDVNQAREWFRKAAQGDPSAQEGLAWWWTRTWRGYAFLAAVASVVSYVVYVAAESQVEPDKRGEFLITGIFCVVAIVGIFDRQLFRLAVWVLGWCRQKGLMP